MTNLTHFFPFPSVSDSIMKIVTNFSNGNESINELTLSSEASSLVAQYKNIIREQDAKIQSIHEKFKELQTQNEHLSVSFKISVELISDFYVFLCCRQSFRKRVLQ